MNLQKFLDVIKENKSCLLKKIMLLRLVDNQELYKKIVQKLNMVISEKSENAHVQEIADLFGEELIKEAISNINYQLQTLSEEEKVEVIESIFDGNSVEHFIEIIDEDTLENIYKVLEKDENIARKVPKMLNALNRANTSKRDFLKSRFINFIEQDRERINFRNTIANLHLLNNTFSKDEIEKIDQILMLRLTNEKELTQYFSLYTEFLTQLSNKDLIRQNLQKLIELKIKDVEEMFSDKSEDIMAYKISIEIAKFAKSVGEDIRQEVLDLAGDNVSEEARKMIKISCDNDYLKNRMQERKLDPIGLDEKITIGLEIEANIDVNRHNEVYGLANGSSIRSIDKTDKWVFTTDATVPMGNEVVSPILNDNENGVKEIYGVCETLNELGYYIDTKAENTAGQINIGINYLDTVGSIINFYEIYGNSEELLYHICNPNGEFIRQSVYINSRFKPISYALGEIDYNEDISRSDFLTMIYKLQNDKIGLKKSSVSLRDPNILDSERFEFKISNGSIDSKTWIDNIRLFGKIVQVSKELDIIQSMDNPTPKQIKMLELKETLKDDITLEEKLEVLMDLLFDDENIKSIYITRYKVLDENICKTGTDKYAQKYGMGTIGFKKVQFNGRYISSIENFNNRKEKFNEDVEVYWRD